jgi:tetrahydromethanopterin S-methyltransferase subunit E
VQINPTNPYFVAIVGFFNVDLRLNVFAKLGVLIPALANGLLAIGMKLYRLAADINLMKPVPIDWVMRSTETMIHERLNATNVDIDRYDLVQLLINARTEVRTNYYRA